MSQHIKHSAGEPPKALVILAAGMGSRIRVDGQEAPKPLVNVGGLPLLKRAILTANRAGVERFVVILGYERELIYDVLAGDEALRELDIEWVMHEGYELKNGVSVLQARPYIDEEFYLTMADHVVEPALYERLGQAPLKGDLALAVDYKLDQVFDMDDATKVRIGSELEILEISKELSPFDAVDTGVFRCSPALFDALDEVYQAQGDASLSEGVKALADQGRAHVVDIGAAWWQDVDDLATRDEAERRLFAALTKSTDGWVSRHINRVISKQISRRLMNHAVSPNAVTAAALFIGILSMVANLCASPDRLWALALGGFLFQLSSVVDGCDGELARLKFDFSEFGAWFDTISDLIVNVGYIATFGVAVSLATESWLWAGLMGLGILMAAHAIATVTKVLRDSNETYLPAMNWSYKDEQQSASLFQRICRRFDFMARRDFYAFAFMLLSFSALSALGLTVLKVTVSLSVTVIWFVFMQNLRTQRKNRHQAHRPLVEGRSATHASVEAASPVGHVTGEWQLQDAL
jgi:CDP-L-myo-inositol myo-inositolphosphotransferase